ncbi:hypothetical protein GCM10011506_29320 [Marivirga lumbricoides]|uniref:HAD-IB family hydrolase n=2 Tax=Marivirga lumbricoides TaxID=1046115 RepID=A0ABQ1MKP8_9BACT|nr:hypothetical protein GCM10011506_29320 [Marivirga lumbricoides]
MQIGFIEKGKVKEKIWHYLLNSKAISSFQNKARFFSLNILPAFLYNEALQRIQYHRDLGDRIIVVSASAEEWLKPWCDINKLELIATKLEKKDGKLTGKMMTPNCKGPEKVKRVKEFLKIEDYSYISAYGDSAGDKEMLQLAHYPFYRKFRK